MWGESVESMLLKNIPRTAANQRIGKMSNGVTISLDPLAIFRGPRNTSQWRDQIQQKWDLINNQEGGRGGERVMLLGPTKV